MVLLYFTVQRLYYGHHWDQWFVAVIEDWPQYKTILTIFPQVYFLFEWSSFGVFVDILKDLVFVIVLRVY